MQTCRRVRRSSVPQIALEMLLEAELDRHDALAVTVGSMDGLLVAGAGRLNHEHVAAIASMRLSGYMDNSWTGPLARAAFRMSVVKLPDGMELVVTSVGARTLSPEVEAGVRRILS